MKVTCRENDQDGDLKRKKKNEDSGGCKNRVGESGYNIACNKQFASQSTATVTRPSVDIELTKQGIR